MNIKTTFFILVMSTIITTCDSSEKSSNLKQNNKCQEIKDIITDCMGLHRGAFNYIDSCGGISYDRVNSAATCEEVFNIIKE